MALPLIPYFIGLIGIGGLGWIGISIMSEVIYWGSLLVALIVFGRTVQALIMNEDISPFSRRDLNVLAYIIFSGGLALVLFQLMQLLFVMAGVTAAILGLLVVLGVWVFGAVKFSGFLGTIVGKIRSR